MTQFKATELDAGMRADVFIASKYPEFTRSSLEGLFESGCVLLGENKLKPSYKIKPRDKLSVDDSLITAIPADIELQIIYEDDDVLVINKPAGVLTHSKGALNTEATVASFIKSKLSSELDSNRAGIVHRLDRATSGVIITAKNKLAQDWLQKQFSSRKTKKTYLAIVEGTPNPAEAIIDIPIARNPKKPQTFYAAAGGKSAQTQYKVIKSFNKNGKDYSILELKPHTGRTHQIRVHLAYAKHPVVGDHIYGTAGTNLLLHAKSLELTLPDRSRRVFNAEPPNYFKKFVE